MRASFHCAIAWPFSAANSSSLRPPLTSPARSASVPLRKASAGPTLRPPGGVRAPLMGVGPGIGAAGTAVGARRHPEREGGEEPGPDGEQRHRYEVLIYPHRTWSLHPRPDA